jgi:epoxide hydrolase-like predicted phosphatase
MSIRAVIWDLGGVLVRTQDGSGRELLAQRLGSTRAAIEELIFSSESSRLAQAGKITVEQHWENVRHTFGLSERELQDFQRDFWSGDRLDQQLVQIIRGLRPGYQTGLLSNHFSSLRRELRDLWNIEDAFDAIVISAEQGLLKPESPIYECILERLAVKAEESVFIDDFSQNIAGAQAVGMHTIHFRNPDQALSELMALLGDQNHGN